ncbi:hypothetical protein CRUP_024652 [Coryphaenoides rupestris]|nr:hypothetical protein CRUP_024652 [Coryphaenoides rupestris]
MENQTWSGDILLLEGLKVTPQSSIPAFILLFLVYIFIMVSNIGLTVLISVERSLHQPMYLLSCNLNVNDVFGATAILPRLLSDILTESAERYITYMGTILTYLKITIACVTSKNRALNSRALQTCSTHLTLYLIMILSGLSSVALHRFPELSEQRKVASIVIMLVPPALNAVIYGLQIKQIRQKIVTLFYKNKVTLLVVTHLK